MEQSEFRELIRRFRSDDLRSPMKMRTMAAYFIYQYNMIGRVDDVADFKAKEITPNLEYKFLIQSRMKRSKNVHEEREAPDQVVFGAGDARYCAQLSLAIHLEHAFEDGHMNTADLGQLLFGVSKSTASNHLKKVIFAEDFLSKGG